MNKGLIKIIEAAPGCNRSAGVGRATARTAGRSLQRWLLCAVVLAAAGCSPATQESRAPEPVASPTAAVAAPSQAPRAEGGAGVAASDFTALVRQVGPAVVHVSTSHHVQAAAWPSQRDSADPLFEFFRRFLPPEGGEREFRRRGVGSGFVIDAEGYVLTNAHVVAEADEVLVRLADSRREFKARVVGSDRRTDIALLKIDAGNLPVARMGDAQQLREQGHVTRGRLGIGIQEVNDALARAFRLAQARGALVTSVEPDSPAQGAGLRAGDIITGFDGEPVTGVKTLPRQVARTQPGSVVRLEIWREGRRALGVDFGLVVEGVAGVNAGAPLQRGDVIVAINNQRFASLAEFNRRVAKVPAGSSVALLVRRGEASLYVTMTVTDA